MNNLEKLNELKAGEKYTLVKGGSMGFVFKSRFVLQEIRIERYAQYESSVLLVVKEEKKRKLTGYRFNRLDEGFLVYEGYVDPVTDMFVKSESFGGFTVQESLPSCSPEYLLRAKRSVEQAPLIDNSYDPDEDVENEEVLA